MARISGSLGFSPATAGKWATSQGLPSIDRVRARPRRIMLRGDSTGIGYLAAYPSGNVAGQRCAPFRRMRDALIGAGYYAQDEFILGSAGYTTASGFTGFDPRVSVGAGWEYLASTTSVFGTLRNNTTASAYTFAPDSACDTCVVHVQVANGKGAINVTFGGITKALNQQSSTTAWASVVIGPGDGVNLGANMVSIARSSSGGSSVTVDAIWCYNSKLPAFQLLNGAASGMKAQNLASSSAGASLYFPEQMLGIGDECWWQIGINDWKQASPTDALVFQGYVEAWADRCIQFGIVPRIILPIRSALTATTVELMKVYDDILEAVAKTRGISVLSFASRWGSFVEANATGLMAGSDDFHTNWFGAQDQGQLYASVALSA